MGLQLQHVEWQGEYLAAQNQRTKTNTLHISLNFSNKDQLNKELLAKVAMEYMDRIGFGDQPYLVYQHFDAAHPHIHILTTNIKNGGRRIETHNMGKDLSEPARRDVELKYNLVRAEDQKNNYGRDQAEVIMNTVGNFISGQVLGDTGKQLSERFGKIMQQRQSISINSADTSVSNSSQFEMAVPASTIASLSSGEFVGMVADNPDTKIALKTFHNQIIMTTRHWKKKKKTISLYHR